MQHSPDMAFPVASPGEPEPMGDNLEESVARLAGLSELKYEQAREIEAKRLKVRVSFLDKHVKRSRSSNGNGSGKQGRALDLPEPEPWPEPIDGADLLDNLMAAFQRYLALPDGAAEAMSLWAIHAHALDAAYISPRLFITSPLPRCGKSTALAILGRLVRRPLPADNVTPSVLFRTVELVCPTLLIDEADTFARDNNELRGIINSGHARGGNIIRSVGDDHEPRQFATFAPLALASIGKMPATIQDRSIIVPMRRKGRHENVQRFRSDRTPELDQLARMIARWVADNFSALKEAEPEVPSELHDRAADNWRPLLAIADLTGGKWAEQGRNAARLLEADEMDTNSASVTLLADIRDLFKEDGTDKLASAKIIDVLTGKEDRPWPEWRSGKPLTVRQLAALLKPFGIKPKTVRLEGNNTPKGYLLADCIDAFSRYLPFQSATATTPLKNMGKLDFQNATDIAFVADANVENIIENNDVADVADKKEGSSEVAPWEAYL